METSAEERRQLQKLADRVQNSSKKIGL